jgi:hypothetical protein
MELEKEQLESMASEFDAKAESLKTEGEALLQQAQKAKKAANHIRQVLCILDPEEYDEKMDSAIDDDNLDDDTIKHEISGELSHAIIKTIFKTGGCHISDIVEAAIKTNVGTKYSTPKAVYRLRQRGLIHSPQKGWFYPTIGITLNHMSFVPGR